MTISLKKSIVPLALIITFILWLLSIWWGWMPSSYDVKARIQEEATNSNTETFLVMQPSLP